MIGARRAYRAGSRKPGARPAARSRPARTKKEMEQENKQANIHALVSMLDESDPEVYQSIKNALFALGDEALPYLQDAMDMKTTPLWQNRIEGLIRELRLETACKHLSQWKLEEAPDLMQGFYFLSSAFYPDLKWENVRDLFNQLYGDCWLLLASQDNLQQNVVLLNNFFFNICKFKIGKKITDGYSFADFFLPKLVNLRQGNDRSLSLAYQYLAQRNKIPVFQLNLPVVNILACTTAMNRCHKADIAFCIDITQRGAMVRRTDVEPILSEQKQIQVCNTVESLQDYAKLLYVMVSVNESDPFRKKAAQMIHQSLGNSANSIDIFGKGNPFSDESPGTGISPL